MRSAISKVLINAVSSVWKYLNHDCAHTSVYIPIFSLWKFHKSEYFVGKEEHLKVGGPRRHHDNWGLDCFVVISIIWKGASTPHPILKLTTIVCGIENICSMILKKRTSWITAPQKIFILLEVEFNFTWGLKSLKRCIRKKTVFYSTRMTRVSLLFHKKKSNGIFQGTGILFHSPCPLRRFNNTWLKKKKKLMTDFKHVLQMFSSICGHSHIFGFWLRLIYTHTKQAYIVVCIPIRMCESSSCSISSPEFFIILYFSHSREYGVVFYSIKF